MSNFIEAVDESNVNSTWNSNSFVPEKNQKWTIAVTVAESNDSQHSVAIATTSAPSVIYTSAI